MIKITDDVYIAADQICEIRLATNRDKIYVLTKRGENYNLPLKYGISAYKQLDEFAMCIDEELKLIYTH